MNDTTLRRVGETGRAALLAFTAVTLGVIQFVQHSLPSPDIVWVSFEVVLVTLAIWILIPTILIAFADRVICSAWGDRAVLNFRAGVFAVAGILLLRSLHVYFAPVAALLDPVGPMALVAYAGVAYLMVLAVRRRPAQTYQAVLYLSLVAVVLILLAPIQMAPTLDPPHGGHTREVPSSGSEKDPVFVFVLDELSYTLIQGDGDLDAERYPNLAALKNDSVWLTDASTNFVHTTFVVPDFIEAAERLSGDYDLRIYDQYAYVEHFFWDDCGVLYTCKGVAQMAAGHKLELMGSNSRRVVYQAAPKALEPLVGGLTGWLDGGLDNPAPNVDRLGMHTFTKLQFETFMSDVDAASAPGRFHFVHLLLPHSPLVYEPGGNVTTNREDTGFKQSDDPSAVHERYRLQMEYVDELLGRFIQRLKDEGLYEKATIVITGDHGVREHAVNDNEDLGPEGVPVDDDVTHVPFLMKAPGLAPAVSDADYQHVDFESTLRDLLKLPDNGSTGISAFATDRPERQRVFYIDQDNGRYWKYIRDETDGSWSLDEYIEGRMPETAENFATTVD